jgi:hypothetical protein
MKEAVYLMGQYSHSKTSDRKRRPSHRNSIATDEMKECVGKIRWIYNFWQFSAFQAMIILHIQPSSVCG